MKKSLLKFMSLFIVFTFMFSTMSVIGSDNNLLSSYFSNDYDNKIVLDKNKRNMDKMDSINSLNTADPFELTSLDKAKMDSNSLVNSEMVYPVNQQLSPLLGDSNYITSITDPNFKSYSGVNQLKGSPSYQSFKNIQSWSSLTDISSLGQQDMSSLYPSDLLVNLNDNDKVEFVIKLQNMNDLPSLQSLFSHYDIDIESKLAVLGIVVAWVPINNIGVFNKLAQYNPYISYAEPNGYIQVQYIPNDPLWVDQWGPQLIGMTTAWDNELGNNAIKVAVIDTGIDYKNPELSNNYLPIGYNWIYNTSDPMDDNGHGTHVSGTIAAAINNNLGIAGLANVSIFAEKFLDSYGYGSDVDAALAINHAVKNGADILSNSWGGTFNSSIIAEAVADAIKSGVIFVAAAGNLGMNIPFFPADLPGVIGVGATDSSDQIAYFSDYGDYVDISAPGVNILSTVLNNEYAYHEGTSMATPHVSGLLALLMSKYPDYTNQQLEDLMYNTAVDLGDAGWDPYYGNGRIDAGSAIFGLQEHNLNAYIKSSSIIPFDLDSTFYLVVKNIGLNDELNVNYQALVNGSEVASGTISSILTSSSVEIPVTIHPTQIATYNITLIVEPVSGETVIVDNTVMKYIQSLTKQIDMQVGDTLSYGSQTSGNLSLLAPFDYAFNVTAQLSPTEYVVSYVAYVDFGGPVPQPFVLFDSIVNPYTRKMTNGIADLFPYWINSTGLDIGDKVDLFSSGGQEGIVVGFDTYNYYGVDIPVLIIDDSYELVYFDQDTGVLISVNTYDPKAPPYFTVSYTNVHSAGFNLHNLKGIILDVFASPKETTDIYFLVMNTGTFSETSDAELFINDTSLGTVGFIVNAGGFEYFSVSWTPTGYGVSILQLNVTATENEKYLMDNYPTSTATVSKTYIVSHVYDSLTGKPLEGAQVDIYDAMTYTLIDSGFTDANGEYKSINLQVQDYEVDVSATGYYSYYQYVFISNPGIYDVYFYLSPSEPHYVKIISPFEGDTIDGGLVTVMYGATDIYSLFTITTYVNDELIGTSYVYQGDYNGSSAVMVPVFTNGTNAIRISLMWFDGSSADAIVTINSENVLPMFYPKPGDYLHYRIDMKGSEIYELLNFTFGEWLSDTEINVTYSVQYFPEGIMPNNYTWFPVNILNGFINDPYYTSSGFSFFFMSNLGFTNPRGHGAIGDMVPYNTWAQVLMINSEDTWNGINTWVAYDKASYGEFYFSKLSGILMYINQYEGQIEIKLTETSFPLTAPAPVIEGPEDFYYEYGSTGNTINWNITGSYPDSYEVSINEYLIMKGTWQSGDQITLNIDGLPLGIYTFTLYASNVAGMASYDAVTVKVIELPRLNSPDDIKYKLGDEGSKITWIATGSDPDTFLITRNETFVASGSWRPGIDIVLAVDVLPVGVFGFTVVISDLEGLRATDTVIVTVLRGKGMPTPGFEGLMLVMSLGLVALVSVLYRKRRILR